MPQIELAQLLSIYVLSILKYCLQDGSLGLQITNERNERA